MGSCKIYLTFWYEQSSCFLSHFFGLVGGVDKGEFHVALLYITVFIDQLRHMVALKKRQTKCKHQAQIRCTVLSLAKLKPTFIIRHLIGRLRRSSPFKPANSSLSLARISLLVFNFAIKETSENIFRGLILDEFFLNMNHQNRWISHQIRQSNGRSL